MKAKCRLPYFLYIIIIIMIPALLTGLLTGCMQSTPVVAPPGTADAAGNATSSQTDTLMSTPGATADATLALTPEPTPDTKARIRALTTTLQSIGAPFPVPITEEFISWLSDTYGTEILTALEAVTQDVPTQQGNAANTEAPQPLATQFTAETWYTLTGNSMFVLADLYTGAAQNADNIHLISTGTPGKENKVTTMTFGGDICFADNYVVMQYLKTTENGITDCIDPALIAQMQAADIAFMNNEFTISDRGAPLNKKAYTFRAAPENTALYQALGIDIVSLANNHAYDFGPDAFADTLATLDRYNIARIGAGSNLEEAMKPVYYLVNGRKIAFVAATRAEKYILTPAATEQASGVLRCYDTELFLETIKEAKKNSDFVIACIHWGTERSNWFDDIQQQTAYDYIDAGADLIIGAHAHRLQGIEYYKGKAIFYNLGNFWFDNYNIETGLLKFDLSPDGNTAFTFLPANQKDCVTTYELGTEKGNTILNNLQSYSVNVDIDENGVITPKEA